MRKICCVRLDVEKQLNVKLTNTLEEEAKQIKQREKDLHNKQGEVFRYRHENIIRTHKITQHHDHTVAKREQKPEL